MRNHVATEQEKGKKIKRHCNPANTCLSPYISQSLYIVEKTGKKSLNREPMIAK